MAFSYKSNNGASLSKSQETLLDAIENLQFPFGGVSKLKDLRASTNLIVYVTDRDDWLKSWDNYVKMYWKKHPDFFMGKHALACHRHQGVIGDRCGFAEQLLREARQPTADFQQPLGAYTRTYQWWTGMHKPKVALIKDHIRDYACKADVGEDVVVGFTFIQEMMHAYFDAFNSKGFPSMEPLEESFSEFAMLSFIDKSPSIRGLLLPYASDYVISKIGKEPRGFGFGIELFERAGNDAEWMINRYKEISNWTEPRDLCDKYNNEYLHNMSNYETDPSEENASKVYENIVGILKIDWEKPFDPIQPAIGEKWDFDKKA